MQQTLVWKPLTTPGVESLRLSMDEQGIHASSHLIQNRNGQSIAATYVLDSDPRWRFRHLWLKVDYHGPRSLRLDRDIRGRWLLNGQHRRDLDPCQLVMLAGTPFTHTPALQRCGLETGQSEQVQVAYIDLSSLRVEARQLRYHCLRQHAQQSLYRCEAEGRKAIELTVDKQSLLLEAQGLYQRMSARTLELNTWV
ncbi:putative glycolipid-binding domain-containing protein [Pseudomonas sp. D(2018)]|uniref:putative glycolipid-binding domain-containing protein n=1 Tax=Pseudomonas sp. D(2018) TaxID=2502238 RepID=UPI0010F82045|nr:putative glycolipid-binding domain-containing protein [Pseudomonas sp. D(2018)]